MRVLVINHCSPNKGDNAVLHFVLRELRRHPTLHLTVSSYGASPGVGGVLNGQELAEFVKWGWDETPKRTNPLGRFLFGSRDARHYREIEYPRVREKLLSGQRLRSLGGACQNDFAQALRRTDTVISTGGHHVTTLLEADAITPQIFDMSLALLAGKPLFMWSQSIGPFEFRDERNRQLVKKILTDARMVCLRDEQSAQQLRALGVERQYEQVYESVIGLDDVIDEYVLPSHRPPQLGIAIYATKRRNENEAREYVATIARLASRALAKGLTVRFFPMEMEASVSDDRPLIRQIMSQVGDDGCTVESRDLPTAEHLRAVAGCRLFLGHKTHSTIFAMVTGTPLIGMAYHRKTADFMRQYGVHDYCIPDDDLNDLRLGEVFEQVLSGADQIGRHLINTSRILGAQVRADFKKLVIAMHRVRNKVTN